jgi:transcriptional regulator with XRE-family HTH domain
MVPQESPAVARRRLRLALRKLRETAGLTQGDVAKRLEWSLSKVNRIELGEIKVSNTDLQALLRLFDVEDEARIEELNQHCRIARQRSWWDEAQFRTHVTPGMIHLLQFAGDAAVIYAFHSTLLPLVQTPAYAEQVLASMREGLSEEQRRYRLDFRLRLQEHIFGRPTPPGCTLIIDESVVLRQMGSAELMIEQLRELIRLARAAVIEIRILPLAPTRLLTLEGAFALVEMSDGDAVLYQESTLTDEIVDHPETIETYRGIVKQMLDVALRGEVSVRLIEAKVATLSSELDRRLT